MSHLSPLTPYSGQVGILVGYPNDPTQTFAVGLNEAWFGEGSAAAPVIQQPHGNYWFGHMARIDGSDRSSAVHLNLSSNGAIPLPAYPPIANPAYPNAAIQVSTPLLLSPTFFCTPTFLHSYR